MEVGSALNPSYTRVNTQSVAAKQKDTSSQKSNAPKTLTPSEQAQLTQLQARDTQVRAHEAAHLAAGAGVVTGGASFTYQIGPDNRQYAIGGEVPIDTSEGSTPEETTSKMRQVRTAALAPADPSPTDYQVAATASILEMRALQEIAKAKQEESITASSNVYDPENNPEHSMTLYG
ncbi:MAG: hypothetical protein IBX45_03360 [Campylobacterales bacterium]|nr:hypothetical protein [Campylobacterales bacterium]